MLKKKVMSDKALWYEKYRPQKLDEYVWTDAEVRDRIKFWVNDPDKMPHMILEGPPGTGKTSMALLLISELRLDTYDYLFINTNKHSGVEAIRETVTNFCETGGFSGMKIVVIDEADGLSIAAQDKLRGVINDYGDYVRFVFTCNKIRALSDALKSRARVFTLRALDVDEFIARLLHIAQAEKVVEKDPTEKEFDVLGQITEDTYPDLRRAIDLLQDCTSGKELTSPKKVNNDSAEWQSSMASVVLSSGDANQVRELVSSMRKDEIEEAYRYLYEKSNDLFEQANKEQAAVILVAEYLGRHSTSAFPEINLAGLLNKLSMLQAMDS